MIPAHTASINVSDTQSEMPHFDSKEVPMSVSIPKQETSTAAPTRSRSIYARMVPIVVNSLFAAVLITLTDILSPIYPRVLETWYSDQYIFELTGKMWAEGGIPYVNFWDQKGPLIFLFNMLGWKLTESSLGIFLLTIVWAAVTVNMLYLLAREFTPQRHGTAMVVTIAWISAVWIGILCAPSWNLIEPLCLPFPRRFPADRRTLVQTVRQRSRVRGAVVASLRIRIVVQRLPVVPSDQRAIRMRRSAGHRHHASPVETVDGAAQMRVVVHRRHRTAADTVLRLLRGASRVL